jgi:cystathionine beta-lyase/cystathionine gamma-synthase
MGINTTFVDGSQLSDFERTITDQTKLIMLESPSSAVFTLQDIREVTTLARSKGITTIIDNTWATPVFQKPMDMGVDLEVHSLTKYIGGHSDVLAGVIIGAKDRIQKIAVDEGELLGGTIAPWNAWLITRSLRTLTMRLERHQKNAHLVASFLEQHPNVKQVRYPGLKSHPQHQLANKQMSGFTGLLGFEVNTQDLDAIKRFFNGMSLFQIGVSWGGHESLIYAPAISYLKELPPERFKDLGISLGDIRISIGLEDANDLIDDLSKAFESM